MKSQESSLSVIPAKAGIQENEELLDPGFRRGDGLGGQEAVLLKEELK